MGGGTEAFCMVVQLSDFYDVFLTLEYFSFPGRGGGAVIPFKIVQTVMVNQ